MQVQDKYNSEPNYEDSGLGIYQGTVEQSVTTNIKSITIEGVQLKTRSQISR